MESSKNISKAKLYIWDTIVASDDDNDSDNLRGSKKERTHDQTESNSRFYDSFQSKATHFTIPSNHSQLSHSERSTTSSVTDKSSTFYYLSDDDTDDMDKELIGRDDEVGGDAEADDLSSIASISTKQSKYSSNKNVFPTVHRDQKSISSAQSFKSDRTGSIGSSIHSLIEDLNSKMSSMKLNLNQKAQRAKELHGELVRLQAAESRRSDKCREQWMRRLEDMRSEQRETVKKQRDFVQRVEEDVKSLQIKFSALKDKVQTLVDYSV